MMFIDLSKLCPPVKSELNSIGLTLAWALPPDLEEDLPPPPLLSDLDSDLDSPDELSELLDSEELELSELPPLLEEELLAAELLAELAAALAAEELAEEAALDAAALTAVDTADAVT
jgi:hypothetical protein